MSTSGKKASEFFAASKDNDLSSKAHRQLVGVSGLLLPILVWLVAGTRPIEDMPSWELLTSVSAYYHTGAVAVYAGILIALAYFLFSYRGYNKPYLRRERVATIIAGLAAVFVAFFPTVVPPGAAEIIWWTEPIGKIHFVSSVVLFGAFVFFTLFLFPKSNVKKGNPLPKGKKIRNGIYYFCGVAMVGCLVWALIAAWKDTSMFWPESLALVFFAVSWLVKGRTEVTLIAVGRRIRHFGRAPK